MSHVCYAHPLRGCGGKRRSNEHYLSRGLLQELGDVLKIQGTAWSPTPTWCPIDRLGAGVLCGNHNRELSPLDAQAKKLFSTLNAYQRGQAVRSTIHVDGLLIERWFLKVLCGLLHSGNALFNGAQLKDWTPPLKWVEVVFNARPIPDGCGVYFFNSRGPRAMRQLAITPISQSLSEDVCGITIELMGFLFHLSMEPRSKVEEGLGEFVQYRPRSIAFGREAEQGMVLFDWPEDAIVGDYVWIEPIRSDE